jgi:hypothetical protein
MTIDERCQTPQIFLLHPLELLWFGQNPLNQQRIHILSRDSVGPLLAPQMPSQLLCSEV